MKPRLMERSERMKKKIFLFCALIFLAAQAPALAGVKRGVWVSVFGEKKALYSEKAIAELLDFCAKAKIDEIYLQLYQSGKAYYDTRIFDRSTYEVLLSSVGNDPVDLLLAKAKEKGIKVFAWLNILSLGKNDKAEILLKHGNSVLTRDQFGRTSQQQDAAAKELDRYYLREEQAFLEPADPRVREYLVSLAEEVVDSYPGLSGVHLDYIRYPYVVPFVQGSRFHQYGLSYGYSAKSLEMFKAKFAYSPLSGLKGEERFLQWDNWRRQQVTELVEAISRAVKARSAAALVSCAVIPAHERAYTNAFQDWPRWLDEGIVDYVATMNYTTDSRLARENACAALALRGKGKVYVGLGVFLAANNQDLWLKQYRAVAGLAPDGVIIFSYDQISDRLACALAEE